MAQRPVLTLILCVLCACFLHLYGLGNAGLIGPDEPRYADIGRAMYESGDWVTPRLFGQPWFEKPVLLYWMVAAGFALGGDDTWGPRLPVALLALAALLGFYWLLRPWLGESRALAASVFLAISAGWLGYSHAAATDLPLTVFFAAGMLLSMPWALRGERRLLPYAAACFAMASLAKGLVPLVLAAPLLLFGWRRAFDWLRPLPVLAFAAISLPWYAFCYARNGQAFVDEFFWKHHVSRFFSPELQHVQPFWFYLPVLLGLLFPAMPLLLNLASRGPEGRPWREPAFRFFAAWAGFGLVFFSASTNKLPGYLLPLLPACCAMLAYRLDDSRRTRWLLAAVAFLIPVYGLVGSVLPQALGGGIRQAKLLDVQWSWLLLSFAAGAIAWFLTRTHGYTPVLLLLPVLCAASIGSLMTSSLPAAGERSSARALWGRLEAQAHAVCIGPSTHRAVEYGLRYYSHGRIPLCAVEARPIQLQMRWPDEPIDGLPASAQPGAARRDEAQR